MIVYKKGDLLEATENIIAHGCNCVRGFESGVAGGDWTKIEAILNEVFHDYDVTVYEL